MSRTTKILSLMCMLLLFTMLFRIPAKAYSDPTLYPGSRGESVRTLQRLLNSLDNARLITDGIYGFGTRNAVRAFQSKYKLGVDGIAGPKTWAKLRALEAKMNQCGNTKTLTYNSNTFIVPKGYDSRLVYKQTTSTNCTSTASNIAVSIARGSIYRNTGWYGGCTWRDKNGSSILWAGYDKTSAQFKLNKAAEIVKKGYPVIIRLGTDSPGHSVCIIGVKNGATMSRITYADLLIADPADGAVRLMSETKNKRWWHGGVISYNGTETTRWSLYVPQEAPSSIMSGFHIVR